MADILIADDEADIVQLVSRFAEHEGHRVSAASNGAEAVELCRQRDFDVVVLDIMMPEMDGFSACREIRKSKDVPIIMLSALGEEYNKLMGFELGIDDYMVKPFSPMELMARIKVVVGRRRKAESKPSCLTVGGLTVDTEGRNVRIDGEKVELTAKEYELLLYFIENRGIALSREQILNAVWGYDYFGQDRTVDWQVKALRSKLKQYHGYIITLHKMGYKFESDI